LYKLSQKWVKLKQCVPTRFDC